MKTITVQQLDATVGGIVHDREEEAKLKGERFEGVPQEKVLFELAKRLGNNWTLTRDEPVKLSKSDLRAVADSRFNRKTGLRLLLLWGIAVMGLFILTYNLHWLHPYAMYGIGSAVCLGFVFVYSRKQRKARQEFGRNIGRDIVRED